MMIGMGVVFNGYKDEKRRPRREREEERRKKWKIVRKALTNAIDGQTKNRIGYIVAHF